MESLAQWGSIGCTVIVVIVIFESAFAPGVAALGEQEWGKQAKHTQHLKC